MCGIAGMLGAPSRRDLEALAAALAHRGPDGEGIFHDPGAGIGLVHRRLAIIDPTAAAAQPMASCGGRYTIVFNGEIYNYRALAAELAGQGYALNKDSDTAVIAPLYDRHGLDCLARLDGIFAFALWDARERELIVARDALGVKPLYYTARDGRLAFASELKALLGVLGSDRRLDQAAVIDYLVRLWAPGDRTPLAAVRKLPPGQVIRVRAGCISLVRWYAPPIGRARRGGDTEALKAEVRDTLAGVVRDQCVSDVPIGAFLSGGIDSSAIVHAMAAADHRPKQTYCIAFAGPSLEDEGFGDDLSHARLMARRVGVPLTEITVDQPEVEALERLAWMLDEPEADPAALYVAAIAAAARADGIEVLLGGTGGDDIFSGYRRHKAAALRARLGHLAAAVPLRWMAGLGRGGPLARRLEKLGYLLDGSDEDFLLRAFEFNRRAAALACLSADVSGEAGGHDDRLRDALRESRGAPLLERMLHLELSGFLPDHNLNYTDKASMAHGVEVRVPFLAPRLVELASRIPWQLKTRGLAEKWILKAAVADWLPPEIIKRRKTGFGAPVRVWLRRGRLREAAHDLLASRRMRERGIYNPAAIDALLRDTMSGRRDGAYLVLALMMLELWLRQFVDAPVARPQATERFVQRAGPA